MPVKLAEVLDSAEAYGIQLLRVEHELRQVPFEPQKCKVLYAVGKSGSTTAATEECVLACGNQAIWTSGRAVRQRYTVDSEILQVCWVKFSAEDGGSSSGGGSGSSYHMATTPSFRSSKAPYVTPAAGVPQPSRTQDASPLGQTPSSFPVFAGDAAAAAITPAATANATPGMQLSVVKAAASHNGVAVASSGLIASSTGELVLCLLLKTSITCIYPSGEVLETPLLQPCQALWPLPTGVLMVGPSDSSASILTHPLEEPQPVVADCSISTSNAKGSVAAFAGWSQERVLWSSGELPYVATYNERRCRLAIWHMRAMPSEAASMGNSFDLPAISPMGLLQPRTPAATAAIYGSGGGLGIGTGGLSIASGFGGFGSAGGAFGSTAGYGSGPAAYNGNVLGVLAAGRSPWTGVSSTHKSVGASTAKRSSLRTPQGCLPASIFNPTPQQQQPAYAHGYAAPGVLRPTYSNTTAINQALLLPGPHPTIMFKLLWQQELVRGVLPQEACLVTDTDGCPVLCVLCKAQATLLAFRLPEIACQQQNVQPAFQLDALAAVPIATQCKTTAKEQMQRPWQLHQQQLDLLVLQPSGQLLLHRGPVPLVHVSLQLPMHLAQQLISAPAAVRAFEEQQQQHWPGVISGRAALTGSTLKQLDSASGAAAAARSSLGCRSMSEGSDEQYVQQADQHQQGRGGPAQAGASSLRLSDLSCAAADRFNVHIQSGPASSSTTGTVPVAAAVSLRVRLNTSWLPGLPCQVLMALQEVLPQQLYLQLLGTCLLQPGACSGLLFQECRAIATVVLAWAMNPNVIKDLQRAEQPAPSLLLSDGLGTLIVAKGSEAAAIGAQDPAANVHHGEFGSLTHHCDAASSDTVDVNMDLATPEPTRQHAVPAAAAATPEQQQQQQLDATTPGSGMSIASSMPPTATRRLAIDTPMLLDNSMLAGPSSQRAIVRTSAGSKRTGVSAVDSDHIPLAETVAARSQGGPGEGPVAEPSQQQQPVTGGNAPKSAWEQLSSSHESKRLLQLLPGLGVQAVAAAITATVVSGDLASARQPSAALQRPHQMLQPYEQQQQWQQQQQIQVDGAVQISQQHRWQLAAMLLALHSVYEDCKLTRSNRHLLQLLGPVCWILAGWLGAVSYQDHYERDSSPVGLSQASQQYTAAAEQLAGQSAANTCTAIKQMQHHSGPSCGGADEHTAAGQQSAAVDTFQHVADALQHQPPGDVLRCLSMPVTASGKHLQYMPLLAQRRSAAVHRSVQLIEAYEVLADCSRQCAGALAAAAAATPQQQHGITGDATPVQGLFTRPVSPMQVPPHCANTAKSQAGSLDTDNSHDGSALAAELEYLLSGCSRRLVLLLVQQGWDTLGLDSLPLGIAAPLKEAVARCRTKPPAGWPIMAYALIGREDVAATLASNTGAAASSSSITGCLVTAQPQTAKSTVMAAGNKATSAQQPQQQQQQQHLLLPYEQRLLLPCSTLSSSQQQCHHQKASSMQAAGAAARRAAAQRSNRGSSGQRGRGLRVSTSSTAAAAAAGPAGAAANSGANGETRVGGLSGCQAGAVLPTDGMEDLHSGVSSLRFSRDGRLAEVQHLLATNVPVVLLASAPDNDPEFQIKQQAVLLANGLRTMALPLGRGALTLGLSEPLPGQHLTVPLLCLSGVIPGQAGDEGAGGARVLVNLDLTSAQTPPGGGAAADVTAWCEFHNGVAAGLNIKPRCNRHQQQRQQQQLQHSRTGGSSDTLSDAWLPHSKPVMPSYAHAGILLGLGLNGHLDRLSWTDLYRYLSDQHDPTTIAVLLGMSACCRGSADSTVARMLFLHLPARHPNTFPEIELSPHVQAASLLGLGLLYQGSCHRMMTEIMLEEISRTPGVDPAQASLSATHADGTSSIAGTPSSLSALMSVTYDREGYALAAGFGLGLICLGQGRNAAGLADLHLEDKLRSCMEADSQPRTLSHHPTPASGISSSNAVSGINTGLFGSSAHRNLLESVLGPGVVAWDPVLGEDPAGHGVAAAAAAMRGRKLDSEQMQQYGISQVVLEGPDVNTAVTGPAAAMGLMLMYLKTGDINVAARFKVPSTAYALDRMRPDMVLLMVLGRSMVMWQDIAASQDWLSQQLPPLLDQPLSKILDNMLSVPVAPGTTTSNNSKTERKSFKAPAQPNWGAIGLAHVQAIAGGCFAIGLRFAGTSNANAEALLRHQLLQLMHAKRRAPGGPNEQSTAPAVAVAVAAAASSSSGSIGVGIAPAAASIGKLDKAAIENSICVVVVSLALVMAGTGHLPTFRLIQMLSRRTAGPIRAHPPAADGSAVGGMATILNSPGIGSGNITYGHHMAINLAAGLLFLSAGRSSLSTSNEGVAALLIALYPVWPLSPTDQRCHLQAFRHLYALATEPRCLQALDVHSRKQVVVPLEITADKHAMCGPAQNNSKPSARATILAAAGCTAAPLAETIDVWSSGLQQQEQNSSDKAAKENQADDMVWSPRSVNGIRTPQGEGVFSPQKQQQHRQGQHQGAAASTLGMQQKGKQLAAAYLPANEVIRFNRHAPCLLPERQHLLSVRVCGPRYWPVEVAAGSAAAVARAGTASQPAAIPAAITENANLGESSNSDWSQLYLQQRICVRKKAGSLPYIDDPSGVKSLLFKAFYCGNSSTSGSAGVAAGQATGTLAIDDTDYQQQQQRQQQDLGFDIVHLCNIFSADPHIQAFAQVLNAATANMLMPQADTALGSQASNKYSSSNAAGSFLSFCQGALYECIVEEKTAVLPWYLQLHSVTQHMCALTAKGGQLAHSEQHNKGDSSGGMSSSRVSRQLPLLTGSFGSTADGTVPELSPALHLQDLVMVLDYHNSSIAAAAAHCRESAVARLQHLHDSTSSSSNVEGRASLGCPQQLQQGWEVEALGWLPLLQAGFCDALWKVLQQHWRQAGMLPSSTAAPAEASSSSSSSSQGSVLESYLKSSSIQAAAAAWMSTAHHKATAQTAAGSGIEGKEDVQAPISLQLEQQQQQRSLELQQLLGSCLSLLHIPSAVAVRHALQGGEQALAAQQQQQQQQPSSMGTAGIMDNTVLQWVSGLASRLPGVPGPTLMLLAAAAARMRALQDSVV